MMRKILKRASLFAVLFLLVFPLGASAQYVTLKTNLLYGATTTPNLGVEVGLGKQTTLELMGGYNPFVYRNNKKFKHWLAQAEFRVWTCERFNGGFFGAHVFGGEFNVGGLSIPFPNPFDWRRLNKNLRYEGFAYGAGVSYGYQWVLAKRWSLEATAGIGYAHVVSDVFNNCERCGPRIDKKTKDYFGPTKVGLSLIYVIR